MKKLVIKPLGENVLIAPMKPETKTASGIVLPESATGEKLNQGKVLGVGKGKDVMVRPGQKVIYNRHSGTEVKIDGQEYLIVKNEDVLAVVE